MKGEKYSKRGEKASDNLEKILLVLKEERLKMNLGFYKNGENE